MIVLPSLFLFAATIGQPVVLADTAQTPIATPADAAQAPVTADAPAVTAPPPRVVDPAVPPAVTIPAPDAANSDVSNAPLTADEAARIALRLQPSLGDAVGAIQTARGRTKEAQAAQNPQVIVGAGYDALGNISNNGVTIAQAPTGTTTAGVSPAFKYSSAIALRQLLYDFNQTRNQVRQNRSLAEAAEANLTRTQLDLIQTVKDAFYDYANAQRLADVNEQNVANRQRQLDLANARLKNGIGLPSDVVTAETSKSQAVLALNQARDAAEQARVTLLDSMGVDPLTPIVPADVSEAPLAAGDVKALVQQGLKSRPEVVAAERSLAASQYGLSAAKSLNLPSVYATVAAGSAGNDFPLQNNASSIGVGLQFPLIDGGQRSGAVQAARGQITAAQADLQTAVLTVKSQVTAAYLELESAEQRVTVADAEVANGREGVRIAEGRYSAGLGSFLDVTTAQALLLTALTDQTTVRNSLDLARANLRHAVGETLPAGR